MNNIPFIKMLDFAMLAYSNTPSSDIFERLHFEDARENGVQYIIGKNCETRQLIIAFRGTDSFQDLYTDLRFWKMDIPYGNKKTRIRVHSGFYKAYNHFLVRDVIRKFITEEVKDIYITGHSYGAALAVLCALDLQYNFPDRYFEVVTFGCPRIGNKHFAKSYNRRLVKTIRFENGNDLVTKIPPAIMGFRHAGIRIHIGFWRILGIYNLREHEVGRYYQSLWNKVC